MRRRLPHRHDLIGTAIVAVWPVAVTLVALHGDLARFDPVALYSGLGSIPFHLLSAQPTTDPNVYNTAYALGAHSASLLAHGHLEWWNPLEGLGTPGIGELQTGALFPFTLLLLAHDGAIVFHLTLEVVGGIGAYWLLRELRCRPVVATVGAMIWATNGTFALLANAAFNPVCFLPLLVLGVERARRSAEEGRSAGWRWLAVGAALCLVAGFVETAVLGLCFAAVIAIQRGFALPRERVGAYVAKVLGGFAAGVAIAAPVLVAFGDLLSHGYVSEHAGDAAYRALSDPFIAMVVSPFLFGRIDGNVFAPIHSLWGAMGGYAGFTLLALGTAGLFGRRDRGLRLTLGAWVAVALADTMGLPPFRQLFSVIPGIEHIVLYRYLPPTWELALVILACLALRDLATATRTQAVITVAAGTLTASSVLLLGLLLSAKAVRLSRALASDAFHTSELLVVACIAALILTSLAPARFRALCVGAVAVAEACVLFAVPLFSWPAHEGIDSRLVHYLAAHVQPYRFAGVGVPTPNLGTLIGVGQLDMVDLPVPDPWTTFAHRLDPAENPTTFTGQHHPRAGLLDTDALAERDVPLYERLGVRYLVADHGALQFGRHSHVVAVYTDRRFVIWRLPHPTAIARAPGCGVRELADFDYTVNCRHASVLSITEIDFPGFTATLDGRAAALLDRGGLDAVLVPAGHSDVELAYLPPGVPLAGVAALAAVLSLLVPYGPIRRRWRKRRDERAAFAGLAQGQAPVTALAGADVEPPTGAISLAEIGLADTGEPTTAAPQVVTAGEGAGGGDAVPPEIRHPSEGDGPPTASTPSVGHDDDPPTLTVEAQPTH